MGWQVYYEYLRITTHPRVHERPLSIAEAMADLERYVASDSCHVLTHTPQRRQILTAVMEGIPNLRGNLVHDCHYAALLREHRVDTIYTADSDFRVFEFLDVVDPCR